MKNLILVGTLLFSINATAASAFSVKGYSGGSFPDAKSDALAQASRQCGGHHLSRVSNWTLHEEPRYVLRCTGRAIDRECSDVYIGTNYTATAQFRCN
ncbi:MAG: hypothetical protein ACXWQO_19595 [Bdellovibrionota bacterium]